MRIVSNEKMLERDAGAALRAELQGKKNKKGKQGIIKTQGTLRIGIQDIHLSSSA